MMNEKNSAERKGPAFGKRHVQVILMFFFITFSYAMRMNLSVAIVAMTDNTTNSNPNIPTYDWTDKSIILSSFYWGYVVLQIPAGKLGQTYGTRWFLAGTMAIGSAASVMIPTFASLLGSRGVMICRMVQGLAQGFIYPSVMVVLGQWVPLSERSRLSTIALSGLSISNVITLPISGYICASSVGWPASFYLFGILGFAWIVPWLLFGANTPEEHKSITKEELTYIRTSLDSAKDKKGEPTPWKTILTSLPVWAYIIANHGESWGFTTLLTEMPTYISKIMKFDIHSNSLLSAAPYMVLFLFSHICGIISDYVINAGYISATRSRKIFTTIGMMGPGLSLTVLGFVPENATSASIVLLITAVALEGATCAGFQVSSIDLSPNFSGVIMGVANGSGSILAIFAPLFVQLIVTDEKDKLQWRLIFLIAAGVYFAATVFFAIFATAEVQWWDSIETAKEEKKSVSLKELMGQKQLQEQTKSTVNY